MCQIYPALKQNRVQVEQWGLLAACCPCRRVRLLLVRRLEQLGGVRSSCMQAGGEPCCERPAAGGCGEVRGCGIEVAAAPAVGACGRG